MARPLISLLHPTRRVVPSEGFPFGWRAVHDAWLERADHPESVEYILAVHESRWDGKDVSLFTSSIPVGWEPFIMRINRHRDCCVDQLNSAASASSGQILIGVQDDLYPPEHWDTLILEAMCGPQNSKGEFPGIAALDEEIVLVCSSGASPERDRALMIAGAMTRSRYERYGFVLDPEFESMFSDDWYAHCVKRDSAAGLCQIIERLDIQFEHRHPIFTGAALDEAYQLQNRREAYQRGYVTFRRKAHGSKVIAVLMPGETFSHRWVFAMFDLFSKLEGSNFVVERYGFHSSNVYGTRCALADEVVKSQTHPEYVLWVDDDNVVSPDNVSALIADLESHPDLGIVCGWCWCDTGDYEDNGFRMSCGRQGPKLECKWFTVEDYLKMIAQGKTAVTSDDIAPDAFWSGFPVVLMRGSVLEQLGWEAFKPMLGEFQWGFTSEDTTFFYRAHQAGIKSAVDLRVKVPHLKVRGIEPQILPAAEREKVMEYLQSVEKTLEVSAAK